MKHYKYFIFFYFINLFVTNASDTLKINLKQADSIFLATNYNLLANALNINAKKAQVLQSKLYPNPIFTADLNAYDPENDIPFHINNTGQKGFQLEQLILLGGKRKSEVQMAKTNLGIAELEFQDLIRNLKYQLHSGLCYLNQQEILINTYTNQLAFIKNILNAYEVQTKKGNIPLKDLVRLKGVYLNLNNARAEIYANYFDVLSKVQIILQTDKVVMPVITDAEIASYIKNIDLNELTKQALDNRPDYLISQQNITLAQQYYKFQKANAIPDLNLFTSYDQRSGAFHNQINLGLSVPLPLWNRNQGNIKAARYQIKENEYNAESFKINLLTSVRSAYARYNQITNEYNISTSLYNSDFETSLNGINSNFQKGNINIIEFVDFFESYNNALSEISRLKIQLATISHEINLVTAKEIF